VLGQGEDARATSSTVPASISVKACCTGDCGSLHSALTSWALAEARCDSRAPPHSTHGLNPSSGADEHRHKAAEACWVPGPSRPHSMHGQHDHRSRAASLATSPPPSLSLSHRPAASIRCPSSWACAAWRAQEGDPPTRRCTARRAPCKTSASAAKRHALSRLPRSSPRARTSSASSAKASSIASTRRIRCIVARACIATRHARGGV
jgi:hypothetical protein